MEQDELLKHVVKTLDQFGIPYMLVGSFGSSFFGEPRYTQDIDIVIELPAGLIPGFCQAFPSPEFYLNEESVRQAVRDRFQFNLLHPESGNKVDFILPKTDEWGRTQLSRRRAIFLDSGITTFVASPEDVILGKLWYHHESGSEKHLRDIAGILRISADQLNRAVVTEWATKLGYLETWERIQKAVDDPDAPRV